MLLVPSSAPLARVLADLADADVAVAASLVVREPWVEDDVAIGSIGDDDALDDPYDPAVDRPALAAALVAKGVPSRAAPLLADALADREGVLDLALVGRAPRPMRPPTLFEHHALVDVLGEELASHLPPARGRIARAPAPAGSLNHCRMDGGVAEIHLVSTNGRTLAGRTHALVHELGHALIGVARHAGRSYATPYGQLDYGRFLDPASFDRVCDEEALVRAIADAWLLRRGAVTWARTWPGAVDAIARDLDADDLAAFARFRLRQGLGLPFDTVVVRRMAEREPRT